MLDIILLATFGKGNRTTGDIYQIGMKRPADSLLWLRGDQTCVEIAMYKQIREVARVLGLGQDVAIVLP